MTIEQETFNVAVIATMSSGKSTTLNAMLGVELLPSMNEACTATIYKIKDIDGLDHFQVRYIKENERGNSDWEVFEIGDSTLKEWNSLGYDAIEIKGDFPHISNDKKMISFFDTPGPNNSSDKSHSEITHNIMADSKLGFILCIMNASQFGVDDERILLNDLLIDLKKKGQQMKIVFAVNKIDQLDIENGESPLELISKIQGYLIKIGYSQPLVVPIMSLISLEIRQVIEAFKNSRELPFSNRKQKRILNDINYLFEFSAEYRKAAIMDKKFKKHLKSAELQARNVSKKKIVILAGEEISIGQLIKADILTGIPLLEEMLELEMLQDSSYENQEITAQLQRTINLLRVKGRSKKRSIRGY